MIVTRLTFRALLLRKRSLALLLPVASVLFFAALAIIRGDVSELVEGQSYGRSFIVEFPSYQAAKDCYASSEYQAAIELRKDAARFDLVIAEGLDSA